MPVGKFIVAVLNAGVPLIAKIHKPVIACPTIRMDNTFKFCPTTEYALESGL